MERLAYKLDIPPDWRIQLIFSVAQLEPAPPPNADPFQPLRPTHYLLVSVDGDTDKFKSFEVERLLNKQMVRCGRIKALQYLVR